MQASARLYQKHIQQTAFSGYLLPSKADSQEVVQTDQCIHTYYYPTPSSCIGFVPSINTHISGGGRTWIVSGTPVLGFTGCIEGRVVHVGQSHGISTDSNLVHQLLFYFSQQLMSSLNQWLLILARTRWRNGKTIPSTGYHTRVLIPQAGGKVKHRSMDSFSNSKNGADGHLTFKWSGPTAPLLSCTKLWLPSSAWNQAMIFLFRPLVPRSWFLLRTLVNILGQMPSLILKQCFSTLASLWKHLRSFKNPSNQAIPPNQ